MPEENTNNSDDNYRSNFRVQRRPETNAASRQDFRRPTQPLSREHHSGREISQPLSDVPEPENSSSPVNSSVDKIPTKSPLTQDRYPVNDYGEPRHLSSEDISLDDDIDRLFPIQQDKPLPPPVSTAPPKKEPRLPIGIYLFIVINVILCAASFLDSANTALVLVAMLITNLVVSAGLLLKKGIYRKAVFYTGTAIAVLSLALVVLFYVQARTTSATFVKNYNQIKSPSAQELSMNQKQNLANDQASVISRREKQLKAAKLFYGLNGVVIAESIVVLIYLRRPRVRAYFS